MRERVRLDIAGAVAVTCALMLAVYAIVNGNSVPVRDDMRRAAAAQAAQLADLYASWVAAEAAWDTGKHDLTFTLPARADRLWLAHIPL